MNELNLQYPIGPFEIPEAVTADRRQQLVDRLRKAPASLQDAVDGLDEQQLSTPYRPGGWTVRQTVHHLADAGMNGFIRTKLAVTEDAPRIMTFEETLWAGTADGKQAPISLSLALHESLHARWVILLESLSADQFARTYVHPVNGPWNLDTALAFFVWHNEHHTAHITSLRQRMGW